MSAIEPVALPGGAKLHPIPLHPLLELASGAYVPDPDSPAFASPLVPPEVARQFADISPLAYTVQRQRAGNVVANSERLRMREAPWGYRAKQYAGRICWIVGSGPSAHRAPELIRRSMADRPPAALALERADHVLQRVVEDRGPCVIALNSAAEVIADLELPIWWMIGDDFGGSGTVQGQAEMLREREAWAAVADRVARRAAGATALLPTFVAHEIAAAFSSAGGAIHWWNLTFGGLHGSAYEEMLHPTIRQSIPRFIFVRTIASAALHAAYWLGFHEIRLVGCEMCAPLDGAWYAREPAGVELGRRVWSPGNAVRGDSERTTTDTVDGREVRTYDYWLAAREQIEAIAAFIGWAGVKVVDYSGGLRMRHMEQV